MKYRYVLASASPRRKELLKEIIDEFEIIPSNADESVEETLAPELFVATLAKRKAAEVALRAENDGKIVIGSDTVVAFGKEILGKPKDENDAYRMLSLLSGRKHAVYTGVCFAKAENGILKTRTQTVKTDVFFFNLSDEYIKEYIRGGSPMDKAGAYGIQDGGLVEKISGSYSNVVGFPVEYAKDEIERIEKSGL